MTAGGPGRPGGPRPPSTRQLRAGELVRRALIEALAEGHLRDPALSGASITVSEVRASPDLKHASAFVLPLGGGDAKEIALLREGARHGGPQRPRVDREDRRGDVGARGTGQRIRTGKRVVGRTPPLEPREIDRAEIGRTEEAPDPRGTEAQAGEGEQRHESAQARDQDRHGSHRVACDPRVRVAACRDGLIAAAAAAGGATGRSPPRPA